MQDCIKVVKQVSQSFYKNHPHISYDEILDVALDAMTTAIETYNPRKGRNFKSWTAFIAHRKLRKHFKNIDFQIEFIDYLSETVTYNPERMCIFKETIENLSDAAKYAIHIIFNEELSTTNNGKNETKRALKLKLRECGFAWNKIQAAFSELKAYTNAM